MKSSHSPRTCLGKLTFLIFATFLTQEVYAKTGIPLEMWVRTSKGKKDLAKIDLDKTYDSVLTSYDIQYERKVKVRGVSLRDLIAAFNPEVSEADTALLRSVRGVVIPVSIGRLRRDQEVYIATRIMIGKKWSKKFPWGARIKDSSKNELPVAFTSNKLVVGDDWRSMDNDGFTPWRYFDSLAAIEFVRSGKYYAQIVANKNTPIAGRLAYVRDCQYCHGVFGWGAKRGPDFSRIKPQKKKELWEVFLQNARNPGSGGFIHFMPAQKSFNKKDAKGIVTWLEQLKKSGIKDY